MFRALSGFKTQFQNLTLIAVSEFDEWRVIVHAPGVVLQGQRQYREAKAKEHAIALAKGYLEEVKGLDVHELSDPEWQPTGPQDWLVWKT